MDKTFEHLKESLGDRYALERQVGEGGMATVYLAKDLRNGRPVAIKVLRPELAIALGPERFSREIQVAARMNHPHILPLYESGDADGLLFFAMPYVEGGSLRQRLKREAQLPIEDAVKIARQAASALSYAHGHGVVHRDIKPENILFSAGEILVADFGIASAIDAADRKKLTSTGLAIGTPEYMSPEQASPGTPFDGRSDVYSLGCVLYEMLIGEPPFTGPTAQVIFARQAQEKVRSLRAVRPAIPDAVEQAVFKALEKFPADRHASALRFGEALEEATTSGTFAPRVIVPDLPWWAKWAAMAVFLVLIIVAAALWPRTSAAPDLDPDVVAVFPFTVSGTIDTAFGDIATGIPFILNPHFTGEGGPRALYPGTVFDAIRQVVGSQNPDVTEAQALDIAESLGAGLLLRGHVFGMSDLLSLSATLIEVPSGKVIAQPEVPATTAGTLPVDQLVARLLVMRAGETGQRGSDLVTKDPAALRSYFAGQQAYNHGDFGSAVRYFDQALAHDPTFALAALGLADASDWINSPEQPRAYALAWATRNRLGDRDRAYLEALVGPNYPNASTRKAQLRGWQLAVDAAPDRKHARFELGDILFHWGATLGAPQYLDQAAVHFRQAIANDVSFAPALSHLVDIAILEENHDDTRRYGELYLAADSTGEVADYYRWRIALALGDSVSLTRLRGRFEQFTPNALDRVIGAVQLDGIDVLDGVRAAEASRRLDLPRGYGHIRHLSLNRGRLADAAVARRSLRALTGEFDSALVDVIEALYWDGDTAWARRVIENKARRVDALLQTNDQLETPEYHDICAVHLWRLENGDRLSVRRAAARLQRDIPRIEAAIHAQDPAKRRFIYPRLANEVSLCAAIFDAQISAEPGGVNAARDLAHLDSLVGEAPWTNELLLGAANLTVASLREANGDLWGALAAVRRRPYIHVTGVVALSTLLYREGQLAARVNDNAGAIQAYQHYLRLRSDPDLAIADRVQQVRQDLERLLGQTGSDGP